MSTVQCECKCPSNRCGEACELTSPYCGYCPLDMKKKPCGMKARGKPLYKCGQCSCKCKKGFCGAACDRKPPACNDCKRDSKGRKCGLGKPQYKKGVCSCVCPKYRCGASCEKHKPFCWEGCPGYKSKEKRVLPRPSMCPQVLAAPVTSKLQSATNVWRHIGRRLLHFGTGRRLLGFGMRRRRRRRSSYGKPKCSSWRERKSLRCRRQRAKMRKNNGSAHGKVQLVSQGKKAYQSSEGWSGRPSRAVDGNTNQNYSKGSCTHTKSSAKPWWRVDLGRAYQIEKVVLWNRNDCCSARLNNAMIIVGSKLCGRIGTAHSTNTVSCGYKTGRNVWVKQTREDYLTLCEVKVYGRKVRQRKVSKLGASASCKTRSGLEITREGPFCFVAGELKDERKNGKKSNLIENLPSHCRYVVLSNLSNSAKSEMCANVCAGRSRGLFSLYQHVENILCGLMCCETVRSSTLRGIGLRVATSPSKISFLRLIVASRHRSSCVAAGGHTAENMVPQHLVCGAQQATFRTK